MSVNNSRWNLHPSSQRRTSSACHNCASSSQEIVLLTLNLLVSVLTTIESIQIVVKLALVIAIIALILITLLSLHLSIPPPRSLSIATLTSFSPIPLFFIPTTTSSHFRSLSASLREKKRSCAL